MFCSHLRIQNLGREPLNVKQKWLILVENAADPVYINKAPGGFGYIFILFQKARRTFGGEVLMYMLVDCFLRYRVIYESFTYMFYSPIVFQIPCA